MNRLLLNIKHRSKATLRAWSYQCESIIAQRSRRVQQLFTFYHRVYGSYGLKQLLRSYRNQFQPRLMLSAVVAAGLAFNWDAERIKISSFGVCNQDIEFLNSIHRNDSCGRCLERNIRYCYCSWMENSETNNIFEKEASSKHRQYSSNHSPLIADNKNHWEPYVSKDEFTIWRREVGSSLYSYKVYAHFDDISASDLLHVQTNVEYRKEWDDTAVALELIERDTKPGTNSDLIYWEMRWPKMFANRDYVFCRRFITDEKRKVIMICNRSTTHPMYPETSEKIRVNEYWSYMVIKPFRNFHEPGVHYIITYFDDPGLAIPQAIKSWITQSQMPEFLKKMHLATKQYACKRTLQMKSLHNLETLNFTGSEYTANADRIKHVSGRADWK